jgi:hypothetical protein
MGIYNFATRSIEKIGETEKSEFWIFFFRKIIA